MVSNELVSLVDGVAGLQSEKIPVQEKEFDLFRLKKPGSRV